ncbi:DUF3883 domain-containing protein [Sphingomonas sp. ID1715]|uniref:DUF3883 domain-containing protein n=1 Tax=Sphingomonas sp. ID1715 TaxID=1656898 RepID=UPI0014882F26|nr:DUF3883 domain-containing protein [Sphingomonas sp. ID1715]NNM76496.1 DUF3883 domain-containing protein [Sphingomonas sp. ID1715]
MTTDYVALSEENRIEYGRAIKRIGKMLLEDRYDRRTHFIYEVLQNAEDALRRRGPDWAGSRTVSFDLNRERLRISHYGAPFDTDDVRGICGIDESTKDITAIGRFGIGFKSVYAVTQRPEVHSGDEAFVILDYVFPSAASACVRAPDETVFLLPLAPADEGSFNEIASGLAALGAEALLFLKHVNEIVWNVEGGSSGSYKRTPKGDGFMREVHLSARGAGWEREETYLLFSRAVEHEGKEVGLAEIAFLTEVEDDKRIVRPITDARLVVFFPTVLPTYTGFLIQGPYQTTPSRDNVPVDKPWNVKLATFTADLLVEALLHLRDSDMLDVAVLGTLPLERQKLMEGLFAPLFDRTVRAFTEERLLPTSTGRFATAGHVRLARAQDVRELIGPQQLGRLLGSDGNVSWVSAEITADRAPRLRSFLMQELKVAELTLDAVLSRMTEEFLIAQSDNWMLRLYRALGTQPALWRTRAKEMPLLRLEDGRHVALHRGDQPEAFLPGEGKTDFPTVRASLCTPQSLKFLTGIGLTKPDPVDDVIRNLLPKYRQPSPDDSAYADDIARILRAYRTDSSAQRSKLVAALRATTFVRCLDAKSGANLIVAPGQVYLAAIRLQNLFQGVEKVYLVNSAHECLRGEPVREMLETCGAVRILRTVPIICDLSAEARSEIRHAAGWQSCTYENPIPDQDIAGLTGLLTLLPTLPEEARRDRARQLWDALAELADRRPHALSVQYSWTYHYTRTTTVDAHFIRKLNAHPWVPDRNGNLRLPSAVLFEELGWPSHPLLESRIRFKPPAIAALAREVGIDADVLDELKRLGVTDLAQLRTRLKADPDDQIGNGASDDESRENHEQGDEHTRGESGRDSSQDDDRQDEDESGEGDEGRGSGGDGTSNGGGSGGTKGGSGKGKGESGGGEREFISYVASHNGDAQSDPDGLTYEERMRLEDRAIERIVKLEQQLMRMPPGNKGFDLIDPDAVGEPQRWIEVKAMKGDLNDRPVGLSQPQMEHARRYGDQYWLYVVEYAADDSRARIVKIRNPFGRTGTFTFDRGWATVAIIQDCDHDADTP